MATDNPLRTLVLDDRVTDAPDPEPDDLQALQDSLGYTFEDEALLHTALAHASLTAAAGGTQSSNERLEFLGDRVLGLVVAHLLFERFPNETVGELARRHAVLVSGGTLEHVARATGIAGAIRMARSEESTGGRSNPTVLADACEAVIAAIYLDGGLASAKAAIERLWLPLVESHSQAPTDAKTALQEWAQGRGLPLPVYEEVECEGPPHAPRFTMRVSVVGHEPVEASGPSKRHAARAAAETIIQRIKAAMSAGRGRR